MLNSLPFNSSLVPVLGRSACLLLPGNAAADEGDYVYKQKFMPTQTMELDLAKTAFFVTDPQNDFLSKESPVWGLVGPTVIKYKVVE